jgi:DNA-binding GntR family transcriptional regulator
VETFVPERVAHVTLSERLVASLRRAIILGELPPGLHLEEPALAEKFGVSRVPVREALARLAHEQLVRLEPRRGAFVVGFSDHDLQDIYHFRLLLETQAVRRAVGRLDAQALARLRQYVAQMRGALQAGDLSLIADPDTAFHQQLLRAAESRRLLAAWEQIAGLVGTILSIADTTYRDMPSAVESHQAIVAALENRDAAAAERLLQDHLQNGLVVMRSAMRRVTNAGEAAAG